jgi:hypothetical protein
MQWYYIFVPPFSVRSALGPLVTGTGNMIGPTFTDFGTMVRLVNNARIMTEQKVALFQWMADTSSWAPVEVVAMGTMVAGLPPGARYGDQISGVTFDRVNPDARHWWFWNTHFNGRVYQSKSLYLTGRDALAEEQRVISNTNTLIPDPNVLWPLQASKRVAPPEMHRYIWDASPSRWLRDIRTSRQLLAGNSLWGIERLQERTARL